VDTGHLPLVRFRFVYRASVSYGDFLRVEGRVFDGGSKCPSPETVVWTEKHHSASEVTTLWRYTDLFIIIIVII